MNGGIVERILVREGEHVREGQELIELNEIQAKAGLNAIRSQWHVAAATKARLEREGLKTDRISADLLPEQHEPRQSARYRRQGWRWCRPTL